MFTHKPEQDVTGLIIIFTIICDNESVFVESPIRICKIEAMFS